MTHHIKWQLVPRSPSWRLGATLVFSQAISSRASAAAGPRGPELRVTLWEQGSGHLDTWTFQMFVHSMFILFISPTWLTKLGKERGKELFLNSACVGTFPGILFKFILHTVIWLELWKSSESKLGPSQVLCSENLAFRCFYSCYLGSFSILNHTLSLSPRT